MWTWLLNPKNMLLTALAALVIIIGGLYLWQRVALVNRELIITRQAGDIFALQRDKKELRGQLADAENNIKLIKRTQQEQQAIAVETAKLLAQIDMTQKTKCLGVKYEKIFSDYTYYFLSGGLQRVANSDSKTGGKILSKVGAANAGGLWSLEKIAENYLLIIDGYLQLEKTVNCYETISP